MTPKQMNSFKERIAQLDLKIKKTITDETKRSKPVLDGIVNVELYQDAPFKILWILKGVNQSKPENEIRGGWDMRKIMGKGVTEYPRWTRTYLPIIYSTWGILHDFCKWEDVPYVEQKPAMIDELKKIAFINLKKLPGYSISDGPEIRNAYEKHKDIILEQIELFDPDIIIGGGTLYYLYKDLNLPPDIMEKKGSYIKNSKLYISHYHPNQRIISDEKYYNDILDPVKKWHTAG